jgi:hypothetical protein
VLCQHLAAVRVNLAESDGFKPSPLKAKAKAANTGEQV